MIGRKKERTEINSNTKETIVKSGYTLVSNKRDFVNSSQLFFLEIYAYLNENFDFPTIKISKEEILEKIKEGKIILISWEDWSDDFKLIVVIDGDKK